MAAHSNDLSAEDLIARLSLASHPEGGWYRQTWVDDLADGRPSGTAIYYLLAKGQRSHWHQVDATEIWHYYAGAPLMLSLSETDAGPARDRLLGPDIAAGARPQVIVSAGHWQAAATTGAWTLVGCTVSPGFRFEGFTLATPDFEIPRADADGAGAP
ncbi:MAG: cupin domain-containing protein [Pseudomonadota bacterium]